MFVKSRSNLLLQNDIHLVDIVNKLYISFHEVHQMYLVATSGFSEKRRCLARNHDIVYACRADVPDNNNARHILGSFWLYKCFVRAISKSLSNLRI